MEAVGEFLHRKSQLTEPGETLSIWSVGCAMGQEAYSLAMVALESLQHTTHDWSVLGTDISPSAMMYANRGSFTDKQVHGVNTRRMACFFQWEQGGWQVQPSLREHTRFGVSNLKNLETCPYDGFDVIYCQNVLIYFRTEMVRTIVEQLRKRLKPGGLLVLGAGEACGWEPDNASRWRPQELNAYWAA